MDDVTTFEDKAVCKAVRTYEVQEAEVQAGHIRIVGGMTGRGTRVYVDGQELKRICELVLTIRPNQVTTATVKVLA